MMMRMVMDGASAAPMLDRVKEDDTDKKRTAPTEPIRQRTEDDLPQPGADEKSREGELDR